MRKLLAVGCWLLALTACVEPEQPVGGKINTITGGDNPHVIPPQACPDWTKTDGNGGSNFYNTLSSNYSCATVSNYGAMIDKPSDMIAGRTTGLTNGARSAVSVTQYETGPAAAASAPAAASSTPVGPGQ